MPSCPHALSRRAIGHRLGLCSLARYRASSRSFRHPQLVQRIRYLFTVSVRNSSGSATSCRICVASVCTSTTLGCSRGVPPVSVGSWNWAEGKLRCTFHAARSTCIQTVASVSRSESDQTASAAEYLNLAAATILMDDTMSDSGISCRTSRCRNSFVEVKTC